MNLTLGDIRASTIPARIGLCSDSAKIPALTNRVIQFLLLHGDWARTTTRGQFAVSSQFLVQPPTVETFEVMRVSESASFGDSLRDMRLDNQWYRFLPELGSDDWFGWPTLSAEYYDNVPTFKSWTTASRLRVFPGVASDTGKTITFIGHDQNNVPIRNLYNGLWQNGERVTLASPSATTVSRFKSVEAVLKDSTNERVPVYTVDPTTGALTQVAVYEYWETRPSYQRWKLRGFDSTTLATGFSVDAQVKLAYVPVIRDTDLLLISNLPALELAFEALKAKDDGDMAKADLLLFGDARNQRLGAIPLLQQELRTTSADRFAAKVRVHGSATMTNLMTGFV